MKTRPFIISAATLCLLTACGGSNEPTQQSLEEVSKQELAEALNERDSLLALVGDVATGLEQIKQLEDIMTVTVAHPESAGKQRAQIMADIASLKENVQQRKKQLEALEAKLGKSTINNKTLQQTVKALRAQIDSQMEEIEQLKQQLDEANKNIAGLKTEVDSLGNTVETVTGERNAAREASVKLENALNTCYYVVATKSELKKAGIIETGFLRKTKLMKADFDQGQFVISDKRTLTILPLKAAKVKILTNHPEGSYELTDDGGQKTIKITNAQQFWSLSNYLVVQKD